MDNTKYHNIYESINPRPHQIESTFKWVVDRAEEFNPNIIIEIGLAGGGSLRFWEEIIYTLNHKDGMIISIDNLEQPKSWDYTNSRIHIEKVYGDSTHSDTVKKVKDILTKYYSSEQKADFLFIDGGHRDNIPEKDFNNYAPFIRNGGGILVADLGEPCASDVFVQLPDPKIVDPSVGMGLWTKDREFIVQETGTDDGSETGQYMKILRRFHPAYMR